MALYLLYGIVNITRRFKLTELLVSIVLNRLLLSTKMEEQVFIGAGGHICIIKNNDLLQKYFVRTSESWSTSVTTILTCSVLKQWKGALNRIMLLLLAHLKKECLKKFRRERILRFV